MHELMPVDDDDDDGNIQLGRALVGERCRSYSGRTRARTTMKGVNIFENPAFMKSSSKRISVDAEGELWTRRVVASMVPDEVLLSDETKFTRNFTAAVLVADATGFTDLSEKYNKMGKGGASLLSDVLNNYIGPMVQEVMRQGGDVIKFAGDAFLIVFKTTSELSLPLAVARSVDTSLIIQRSLGRYETEVGVSLRIKIVVSAGEVYLGTIGNESFGHYILIGNPVWECKEMQHFARPGDVLVTKKCFLLINTAEYMFDTLENRDSTCRVHGFSDRWKSQGDRFVRSVSISTLGEFMIRPSIKFAMDNLEREKFWRFLIPVLQTSILMKEPIEYLNEMRNVVIAFVNVVVVAEVNELQLIHLCDQTFQKIHEIVVSYGATLNKATLFDKDMMFLTIFGLRGFKRDIQSKSALRCSSEIIASIKHDPLIKSASVGVTCGNTYCGVLGHGLRQEYSVIGVTVNKAARLMIAYPGIVSCDNETFTTSNLPEMHFSLLQVTEMKGIEDAQPNFKFLEIQRGSILKRPREERIPIIGRDDIFRIFNYSLNHARNLFSIEDISNHQRSLLIRGDPQLGKSCLLDGLFNKTFDEDIPCCKLTVHMKYKREPYRLIYNVMNVLMDVEDPTPAEREAIIRVKLQKYEITSLYFALNAILGTNFPKPQNLEPIKDKLHAVQRKLFKLLCDALVPEFMAIFIDNLEFADDHSIFLLTAMLEMNKFFFVFTTGNQVHNMFERGWFRELELTRIDKKYHKNLACQCLGVDAVDIDIERIIHQKSNGNPGWIAQFLRNLVKEKAVIKSWMTTKEAKDLGLVFPDDSKDLLDFLTDIPESLEALNAQPPRNDATNDTVIHVATLKSGAGINFGYIAENIDVQVMILYDSLSLFEQQVVKCASVLGRVFVRSMLNHILSENDRRIAKAIQSLFELRIFKCAEGNFSNGNILYQKRQKLPETQEIKCRCYHLPPTPSSELQPYAFCGYIIFKSPNFWKTSYDLLTDNNKKEYHMKALSYYEHESRRCDACDNTYFIDELYSFPCDSPTMPSYRSPIKVTTEGIFAPEPSGSPKESLSSNRKRSSRPSIVSSNVDENLGTPTKLNFHFGSFTFDKCECRHLLYVTFNQIEMHARGANIQEKIVQATLEKVRICVKISEFSMAVTMLDELKPQLEKFFKDVQDKNLYIFYRTQLCNLQVESLIRLDQPTRAKDILKETCKIFKTKFPMILSGNRKEKMTIRKIKWKLKKLKKYVDVHAYGEMVEKSTWIYEVTSLEKAKFFKCLFAFFMNTEHHLSAYAAVKALKIVVQFSTNIEKIILVMGNVIMSAYHLGLVADIDWLRTKSCELCLYAMKGTLNLGLLRNISYCFHSLIITLTTETWYDTAVSLGLLTLNINHAIGAVKLQWAVVPLIFTLLLTQKRYAEIATMLARFYRLMHHQDDLTGLTWYYAMCMDVLLDTSITIRTFSECKSFYVEKIDQMPQEGNGQATARLNANLWLFCARTEQWHFSVTLKPTTFSLSRYDTCVNVLTSLRILEAKILTLIRVVETKNFKAANVIEYEIWNMIEQIDTALVTIKYYMPRFVLLQVYFFQIVQFCTQNICALERIKVVSLDTGNFLVHEMAHHNLLNWICALPDLETNFWMEHCGEFGSELYTEKEWLQNGTKFYYYTLKMPR